MVLIDFKVDENELAENLDNELDKLKDCFFVSTLFIMPVRIQIEEFEIFEFDNDPWAEMPIMNIASAGLRKIKELKIEGTKKYDLPEGAGLLEFNMLDEKNVKVSYTGFTKPFVTLTSYNELLNAFEKFAEKVRMFLWERAPQINNHPYWGPWLRGERD